jgi:hypothetical protein
MWLDKYLKNGVRRCWLTISHTLNEVSVYGKLLLFHVHNTVFLKKNVLKLLQTAPNKSLNKTSIAIQEASSLSLKRHNRSSDIRGARLGDCDNHTLCMPCLQTILPLIDSYGYCFVAVSLLVLNYITCNKRQRFWGLTWFCRHGHRFWHPLQEVGQ